ncbi:MAG: NAD(P)H-binding protein [Microthrixaceae bacterium]|nr:NAD(P)H-binding protein [Microthrixaceae bacterium]
MKVAVTAASGRLGSEIVRALLEHPSAPEVVGLARTPGHAEHLGVEVRPGDYDNPGELQDSLDGVDAVLLVSGMDAPDKRIGQHRNVIAAATEAGVTRIVYTSIQGAEEATAFSPVVQSNRQTEADVRDSGLDWVIGRNGIYIEADVDYVDTYVQEGGIRNCAGEGRCGYTTRPELAQAYAQMLTDGRHDGRTYNLHGEAISQYQLAEYLNSAFGTHLEYIPIGVEEYRADRTAALGEFMGSVISGIYEGIRRGALDNPSDFREAAGRAHIDWATYFARVAGSPGS